MFRSMARFYWWSGIGLFEAEANGLYPQARHVVAHYRRLSGWSRDQLAIHLKIESKAVYYAEHEGRGLDSIARLRELCALLHIPPALLGLCDAPGPAGWWLAEYDPWLSGADGWPNGRAVVKHYRRAKSWNQSDFADALGVKLLAVQKMENSGSSLDSLTRRLALRFLLAIPPVLFGLDSEHVTKEFGGTLIGSAKGPTPELITSFRASTDALFAGHYTGHAQDRVLDTLSWLSEAREVRAMTKGNQRLQMLEVESLGYQALAEIENAHASDVVVFSHANRAVQLARDSANVDLLAVALLRRSEVSSDRGYIDLAQRSMNEALLLPVQDDSVKISSTVAACRILAEGVSDEQGRSDVLALIDQARPMLNLPDTFHRYCNRETIVIRQAQGLNLLAAHAPQAQARDLLRRSSDMLLPLSPETPRRAARAKLALAQAYLGLNELDYAATFAVETLPLMDQVKSVLYLPQLVQIYHALRKSKLRDDPNVSRLGLYLHGHGVL